MSVGLAGLLCWLYTVGIVSVGVRLVHDNVGVDVVDVLALGGIEGLQ